jgi:hypothetical protein
MQMNPSIGSNDCFDSRTWRVMFSAAEFEWSMSTGDRPFEPDKSLRIYRSETRRVDGWGRIELFCSSGVYCLRCVGVGDFFFSRTGRRVKCFPDPAASATVVDSVLYGPVRATLLELQGLICLHASAVVLEGAGVGFVGHSGYGKSTVAAAFVAAGYPLLTDDILAVCARGSRCLARPGNQWLRLSPDAASILGPDYRNDTGSGSSKHRVPVNARERELSKKPVPLAALYVLDRQLRAGDGVAVEALSGSIGLIELIRFSFCARVAKPLGIDRARFALLGRLAQCVPVRVLRYAEGFEHLRTVCRVIQRDISAL